MNGKVLADNAIRPSIMKTKRQLVVTVAVLQSSVLLIKTRTKLFDTYVELVLLYD